MARFLLDTNICVYMRRGRPLGVLERFRSVGAAACAISVVTYGELRVGIEKRSGPGPNQGLLDELNRTLTVLPVPKEAGDIYGRVRADLERRGQLIGGNDLWIAAHALAAGLVLVTNNEREFRRIPGLAVENWAA